MPLLEPEDTPRVEDPPEDTPEFDPDPLPQYLPKPQNPQNPGR